MKKYTIGALFTPNFEQVLLIQKNRPDWQKGKYNLPGGHIEEHESGRICVAREFNEEASVNIPPNDWVKVGRITNHGNYFVEFFTSIYDEQKHGKVNFNASDEELMWCNSYDLPATVISNLKWLIPFAINIHQQGNHDNLVFGEFQYQFPTQQL